MRIATLAFVLTASVAAVLPAFAQQAPPAPNAAAERALLPLPQKKPVVQIAILIDTSGSMEGLIEQAKAQLWKIVNEFAKAQRGGLRPDIQVALYHYGSPELGRDTNFVKQLVPLTDDLDKVSAELFKLKTSGGDEFCGAVIAQATSQLSWSAEKGAYKAIFIAGNEPFTQGPVDFRETCKDAIAKGIIVNTIFCGSEAEGLRTGWKDGAALADGSFMSINQNAQVAHIESPQDKELAELGLKINKTYVTYGVRGAAGAANQMAQDSNAMSAGGFGGGGRGGRGGAPAATAPSMIDRTITKSSTNYRNSAWDLVDAIAEKKVALKDIKEEDLPEEMQKLDQKGREDFVAQKQKERTEMQARIQQLGAEREKFLAEKRKEQVEGTLDTAIITTVRNQAQNNGMTFEAPK